ncbi:LamG domain-containing protein [Pseudopedobacter beijingensis]|uniref:LamG domain-containing protein n=1 Tax=Pseudopedobacter beijingensis TaxID=1207056 RepID=A0ABW4IHF7_9SPHI
MKTNILKTVMMGAAMLAVVSCKNNDDPKKKCEDEILRNHQTGLVAYYKFADGSLNDLSGNGLHGVLNGSVTKTTNANNVADCALRFGGTANDYVKVASNASVNFDGTTPISIVLWFKAEDPGSAGKYQVLFGRGEAGVGCSNIQGDFSLGLYESLKPIFGYNKNNVWDETLMGIDVYDYHLNKGWQNLIAVYDPTATSQWKIYRDGNMSDYMGGLCDIDMTNTGDIYIGRDFKGSIDDIKVYSRALSATEIDFMKSYVSPCCE